MVIEVIAAADRTDEDLARLYALSEAVYGPPDQIDSEIRQITWAPTEYSIIIRCDDGDDIVAHAGVLVRNGTVNGQAARIGGVGGVKTHPDVRGQHLGQAVMTRAAEFMKTELDVDFGLLVCAREVRPFYERLGWSQFSGELWVDQPGGRQTFEFNRPMLLQGKSPIPVSGVIDLNGNPW